MFTVSTLRDRLFQHPASSQASQSAWCWRKRWRRPRRLQHSPATISGGKQVVGPDPDLAGKRCREPERTRLAVVAGYLAGSIQRGDAAAAVQAAKVTLLGRRRSGYKSPQPDGTTSSTVVWAGTEGLIGQRMTSARSIRRRTLSLLGMVRRVVRSQRDALERTYLCSSRRSHGGSRKLSQVAPMPASTGIATPVMPVATGEVT